MSVVKSNIEAEAPAFACCQADSIFSNHSDQDILRGLYSLIETCKKDKQSSKSFLVQFKDEAPMTEDEFELALWTRLQSLHDKDHYAWDIAVSAHPRDGSFRFSAGHKIFKVFGHYRQSLAVFNLQGNRLH